MFGRPRDVHFNDTLGGTLFRSQYTHDIVGNRLTAAITQADYVGESRDNTRSQTNVYDRLNRLILTRPVQILCYPVFGFLLRD